MAFLKKKPLLHSQVSKAVKTLNAKRANGVQNGLCGNEEFKVLSGL